MSTGKFELSDFERKFLKASSEDKPKIVFEAVTRKEHVPQGFVRPIMEEFANEGNYGNAARLAHYIGETKLAKIYAFEHVYGFMGMGNLRGAKEVAKSLITLEILTEVDFKKLFVN